MLQAELSSLAVTDELTGLYNRKRVRRSGRDLLLFFIDVDDLIRINGSFSDSEGDFALIRTAEVLVMTFRKSDVLARLDGDEFAVLAIESSSHCEATIMARLHESLETVSAQEPRYPLSLRVGVVRLTPKTTRSITELMLEVDRAMYQVKRNHRRFSSAQIHLRIGK